LSQELLGGHPGRRLGVDPNDVGLSYTGTLARSSGFVVVYLMAAAITFALVQFTRPMQAKTIGFGRQRIQGPAW
jgi:hypothetical protein